MTNDTQEALQPLNYSELVERPQDLIQHSKELATEFTKIVDKQKLFTEIQKKKHVHVDGWSMLGVLMGIFPQVERVERINADSVLDVVLVSREKKYKDSTGKWAKETYETWIPKDKLKTTETPLKEAKVKELAYKAVVSLRTLKGHAIGQVESICSNREAGKLDNEEYAINSMAQTRGVGKAFRLSFGWIARVAGYDSTPFEEVENLYPDREVATKPHASIEVMDSIRTTLDAVKTDEDYAKAMSVIKKYDADLNDEDKDEVRGWCMDAKKRLNDAKKPQEPQPEQEAQTTNPEQNVNA